MTWETSPAQLAMIRSLAALSVLVAASAVMLGPRADLVAADSTTQIPATFAATHGGGPAAPAPEVTVRLHTASWSDPLAVSDDGTFARGDNPDTWDGPVLVEVAIADDRHVEPIAADPTIRLGVVDVASSVSATVVGPGGRRRAVAAGDLLVPGPYTVGWTVGNREARTAAVRIDGDQILQIRPDGVTVLPPLDEPAPAPSNESDGSESDVPPPDSVVPPDRIDGIDLEGGDDE